jgi:hypothetical protein
VKKFALAMAFVLAACSRNIDNGDAVRQGVIDYLRARTSQTGLDVDLMQVDVTSVSFQKDEARATVNFRPKGVAMQGGMQMSYTLDRKSDKWVVRGRGAANVNPHGGGALPGAEETPGLPPGHPPGAIPGDPLPPGHPSVGSKQ